MGASKRIAEMLVAETAQAHRPAATSRSGSATSSGSTGSVVPIFQEQLENGEPADDHRPGHDPLLHDHPRGRLAHPRRGRDGPRGRRPVRPRHGRAGQGPRPRPRPRPRSPAAIRRRSPSRSSACDRARSSTKSCSTRPKRSSRPSARRSCERSPRRRLRASATRSGGSSRSPTARTRTGSSTTSRPARATPRRFGANSERRDIGKAVRPRPGEPERPRGAGLPDGRRRRRRRGCDRGERPALGAPGLGAEDSSSARHGATVHIAPADRLS